MEQIASAPEPLEPPEPTGQPAAPLSGRLLVIDASDELQAWADALTQWAQLGGPDWPGPAHDLLPTRAITVARLWSIVEEQFYLEDLHWSVARTGLPQLTLPDGSRFGSDTPPSLPPEPNSGSMWHNTLHACLGNFHR